jgi:cell division protein FtsL
MASFSAYLKSGLWALAPVGLLLSIMASAVAVVGMKQHGRSLQTQAQELAAERERLEVEYNQLRLERGTIGAHARIEELAVKRLNMRVPDDYAIIQAPPSH